MTGDTDDGRIFDPQYIYRSDSGEGSVKHLSFSTAAGGAIYLEADLFAGSDNPERVFSNHGGMFSVLANGYVRFFGKNIYKKLLIPKKWYLVDILLDQATNTAMLYIDGEELDCSRMNAPLPEDISGAVFIKKASSAAYLDDISLTSDNNDPSVTFMSDSPYYANTISYLSGTVDTYSQSRERFIEKLRLEGASDAVLLNSDGTASTSDNMSAGKYLRITTDENKSIYYMTKTGGDSYLSSLDSIDIQNDASRDTEGYYVYEQSDVSKLKGSALDMSFVLDAPAGKHGFVQRNGDKFVLSKTNEEIKFWGTNLSDKNIFLEHEDAEKAADRIAQMGFNIVRIHKFDYVHPERGVLKLNPDTGKAELDPVKMDKLCYLLAELKERGIYWDINLYVGRPIYDTDNVDYHDTTSMFPAAYWNQSLIDVQNEFANQLLSYYNPYTKMKIADDPALALVDMVNERTVFASEVEFTGRYYDEINEKFSAWLKNKYSSRFALKLAWAYTPNSWFYMGLLDDEDPWTEGKPVKLMDENIEGSKICRGYSTPGRSSDINTFLCEVESDYYAQRVKYLRDSVGVQCPITGGTSFTANKVENYYALTQTDFISNHYYWGGGDVDLKTVGKQFDGRSQLEDETFGMIGSVAAQSLYGMPQTIDEWNHCAPNAYAAEGPILASAYGSLDNLNFFAFAFDSKGYLAAQDEGSNISMSSPYSIVNNPVCEAVYPAASAMSLRGDVKESESGYYESISKSDVGIGANYDDRWISIHPLPSGKNQHHALIGKTGSVFNFDGLNNGLSNDSTVKTKAETADSGDKKYVSLTGELTTDLNNKVFTANTNGSQAVCGFIGGKTISLDNADIKVDNDYAAVSLTSIDSTDANIQTADRLLLTLAGDTRNYAQIVEEDAEKGKRVSTIKVAGKAPIMVEQITGEITLKLDGKYAVYTLTSSGERKQQVPVSYTNDGFKLNVTRDMETMHFEIIKN